MAKAAIANIIARIGTNFEFWFISVVLVYNPLIFSRSESPTLARDFIDLNLGPRLTMTEFSAIAYLAMEFDTDHLAGSAMSHDCTGHFGAGEQRCADFSLLIMN